MNARLRGWRICFAFGVAALAASCASEPTAPPAPTAGAERGDAEGLLCVRYTLDTDAPRMEAVAAAFATRLFPTPDERATLAHEGLQVAIVPASELPDIRTRLGPLAEVTRVIVGQSANWVELAHRDLGADDLVMMDGAFMRGDGGALRISVRDAVMPDADGGCVQTEVAMHLTPATLPLQSLPGDGPAGRVVMQSAIECCLHDGEALLILPAPTVSTGKGPATTSDLPPTAGVALLGERASADRGKDRRGYSVAIALIAKVPAGIRPSPAEEVDVPAVVGHTPSSPVDP